MVQVNYFQDRYLPNVRVTSQSSDSGSDSQSFFQWELDKPTPSFNKTADQLIFEGIDQFAKMTTSSNEARTVFAVNNLVQGKGAIGALTPFAIPYVIGKGIQAVENYQQNKRHKL
jgi:DNA-binding MltR family transcriptional regulator